VVTLLAGQASPVRLAGPAKDKLKADRRLSVAEPRPAASTEGDEPVVRWPDGARERTEVLEQLLERCRGNVSKVARLLGKRHTSVRRWIKLYGIDPDRYRS
jgi:DNA-binding NtrC family response regulator